jgi:hypothetical protein
MANLAENIGNMLGHHSFSSMPTCAGIKPSAALWVAGLAQLFHTCPVRLAKRIQQHC